MEREYPFRGKHVVSDITNVDSIYFERDHAELIIAIQESLIHIGATIIDVSEVRFPEGGMSVVWTLAESHTSVHSYPEYNSLFFDSFTCGEADPEIQINFLREKIGFTDKTTILYRGEY